MSASNQSPVSESKRIFVLLCMLVTSVLFAECNGQSKKDCLKLFETENGQGYVSAKGDTLIREGKYSHCFSKQFCNYAIVATEDKGIVAIDRSEKMLFQVFVIDNGPDEISNGLFRIVKDGKIGYANASGSIVIAPIYSCAEKFTGGKAKVSLDCTSKSDGEHTSWSGNWIFINQKGDRVSDK